MARNGETKNASELTENDLRFMLEKVQQRELNKGTYIPVRGNTPPFFIDVVAAYSNGKVTIMNVPMAETVEHLTQNMEEEDGQSYGDERPHDLSIDDIVTISYKMSDPTYIVLQKNGRFAEVVSYYNKQSKKVIVSIDIAKDGQNYKDAAYLNGYSGGYYNIIVTQYTPDSFERYLKDCEIIYDKQKMNGIYQVGSGRVVTVAHDSPFINNSISQPDEKNNPSERNSSPSDEKLSSRSQPYGDYDKPITLEDISILRSIGRKSINEFTSEDIQKAQKWAYKFYKELGTKSPFFRTWFGDWRSEDKTKIKYVPVNADFLGSREQIPRGDFSNKDTNWIIKSTSDGIDETTSKRTKHSPEHRSLKNIKVILEL